MKIKIFIYSILLSLILAVLFIFIFWSDVKPIFVSSGFGRFPTSAKVEFISEGKGAGRLMRLLEDFSYIDPQGTVWTARKGYETDGASIPKAVWSLVGGPFEGLYRDAAIIHDWYCYKKDKPWRDVHRVFYYASRAAGVQELEAKKLYLAVRIGGPKWGSNQSNCFSACHAPSHPYRADRNGIFANFPVLTVHDAERLMKWVSDNDPSLEEIEQFARNEFPKSTYGHSTQ